MNTIQLEKLNSDFASLGFSESMQALAHHFQGRTTFSSSLGPEDQVITDMVFRNNLPVDVFTLDTGRLFAETYVVLEQTRDKYQGEIRVYYPRQESLQDFVSKNGVNAFYQSFELRKSCCFHRKIEPLNRALTGAEVWITGIRAAQSGNRENMQQFEWDPDRQLIKFNPLLRWSTQDIWHYINTHEVPYNALHKRGFPSIGCQPCTRAIGLHEEERAGRWWWEQAGARECGLHRSAIR